ncbi:hypothetical protein CAP47_11280 [Psychroflexus sp. S27]|uniref:T9SS-dependent choice-of-anchor J family protein n=1 Tax=Psychroflexus sp. S27 TaxID=1982757 RepID=UPI000C2ACE11|nr:choice-of-anchor J domain-containing protein [Psychroflexus sp. S27]PJX20813.1 hypothetical protein CAP47_11280 [Psychroflexus sp. S27]
MKKMTFIFAFLFAISWHSEAALFSSESFDSEKLSTLDMNPFDSFEAFQANCTSPQATTSIDEDCVNGVYTINVDVTDMGDATSLTITNDLGAPDMPVTETGVVSFGPIPVGTVINLVLEHDQDSQCNVDLGAFKDTCPAPNDTIAGAIPITPSAPGTGCDTFTFSYDFGDGSVSDSGLNTSCDNENTGHDLFFSWTATSSALVWNDGDANPGIAIRQLDGTEIICESSFASEDTILSGWNVGDDLIIQIYDTYSGATNTSFCLEELTCPAPSDLVVSNITTTEADLSWTSNGGETEWSIIYGAEGFDPATEGTEVVDNDGVLGVSLTGLMPSSIYDFYVKANCSPADESYFSQSQMFATVCEAVTTYFLTENFDGTWFGSPEAPLCWTVVNNDNDASTWNKSSQYITPHSGSSFAQGTGNNDDYLISPALDLSSNSDMQMLWFDAVEGASYNNTYDVLVSTTDMQISSFTDNLGTFDVANEEWLEHTLDLSAYAGETIYVAFHQTYSASSYWGFAIDDVTFMEAPTCIKPSDVTASNISGSSLDLSWNQEASEVNGYEWYMMLENEDLAVDTPIQTGTTGTGVTTVSITGLSETTTYDVYVRTDCGVEGMSDYSDTLTVETTVTCAAPTDLALNETNVTSTSAEFTWTVSASEELGYDWVVMAEGEDPEIDTPVESGTTNPGDSAVTVTGLTAATVYDFYILSNCDANGLSDYEGPESFQTACETFVPDYLEDFSGFLPVCWEEAEDGDFATGPASYGSGAWTSDGFLNNGYSGAARINLSTTTRSEWLISPAFDLSADGYEVVFDIGITAFIGSDNSAMGSDDEVYALYSLDGVTWTVLQTWEAGSEPSNTGETVAFDLSGITGANVKFAIYATDGDVNDSEDYYIFIDNFKVRTPLICPEVYDLSVSNITQTEADLTWTDNTEAVNGYVWSVFEEGEDPETATAVATGSTAAGEVTATVNGLSPSSTYQAYVRADCDTDGMSTYSASSTFETLLGAVIVTPGTTESGTYCYENTDFKEWLFESSDGSPLTIEFIQGTLETNFSGGTWDDLMIYDGSDDTGVVLYDSDNPTTTAGELAGLIFTAQSGMMYITLDADFGGSCASGGQTEIIFNVDAGTASNQDFFSDANFSYYPNPVESRFVINSTYELEQIVIYNMLGQEVREISPESTEVSFDLSDVQAGVYLVKATVKGQTQTFRLIKE